MSSWHLSFVIFCRLNIRIEKGPRSIFTRDMILRARTCGIITSFSVCAIGSNLLRSILHWIKFIILRANLIQRGRDLSKFDSTTLTSKFVVIP